MYIYIKLYRFFYMNVIFTSINFVTYNAYNGFGSFTFVDIIFFFLFSFFVCIYIMVPKFLYLCLTGKSKIFYLI